MDLSSIYQPVSEELRLVEGKLDAVSRVDLPEVAELLGYALNSAGKRIRPVLTLLAGKLYEHNREHLLNMAAAVEVMHTATLVHDDAIDKSETRRGKPTVNRRWGDEKAVLVGDYLFAEAGALTASTGNQRAIELFAETLKTISYGELNQAFSAFNFRQSREQYIVRVARKTAALFRMATESGAVLSRAPAGSIEVLIDYGYNLGIAFQVVDDILDFTGTEEELGKPVGSDLTQGTITLPVLLLRQKYPVDARLTALVGAEHYDAPLVKAVVDMVRQSASVIAECYRVADGYCARACRDLRLLPESVIRDSLGYLAEFVTRRRK